MDKWLTRSVLVITAVILAMVPVGVTDRGTDPVLAPASRPSEDRLLEDGAPKPPFLAGVAEEEVTWWVDRWWTGEQGPVRPGLKRMGRYEDYIDAELAARDLPPSLRYLPLIESGYNPLAVSPMGAAGLWQLMPETARSLGLEVNALVDERFDVYAATQAALDYLVALHDRFQCWSLALAAYNGGPTRIERAIRSHGGERPRNDALFGHIRDWLPSETRDFVPRLLASIRLAGDRSFIESISSHDAITT